MLDQLGLPLELGDEKLATVELPEDWTDFPERRGMLPNIYNDRRRFARYYYRGPAIVEFDGRRSVVFTKDLSRCGIGFYHYQQLFPLQEVRIWLPGELGGTNVRIARCCRIQDRCYECGATFLLKADRDTATRQIEEMFPER